MLDIFVDEGCELAANPLLRPLSATSIDVLRDADKLNAGGVLLLGARTTDGAASLRALTELRRRNSHVIVYLCTRWDRSVLERFTQYVRAGIDEAFAISGTPDVLDLVQVVSCRVLAPPPVSALRAIAELKLEGRPLRFALHAFRNSQFAVHLEDVAKRWGHGLRTLEGFVATALLPCARDLFRCGRFAHEDALKQLGVTSATERALRLGFDSASDLRKWKWRLKVSANADVGLHEFAEQIPGLEPLLEGGTDR